MNRVSTSSATVDRSLSLLSACFLTFWFGGAAFGALVDFRLATLPAPSVMDTAANVPASQTSFAPGSTIYAEVWVQTSHANGLSSASLDISFDQSLATAAAVAHPVVFSTLTHGSINNTSGLIDDLSGSHLGPCSDAVALAPNWARVAVIEMTAGAVGLLQLQALPSNSPVYGTAVCAVGDVAPAQIVYGTASVQIGDAPIPAMSTWSACVLALSLMIAATQFLRGRILEPTDA